MKKDKVLSYDEFMELAMKNYLKGGDSYYECWDEETFSEYVQDFGYVTYEKAVWMFRISYDHERDVAGYFDY